MLSYSSLSVDGIHPVSLKKTFIAIFIAALLWFLMFSPWTSPYFPFWWSMTASVMILSTFAFLFCKEMKHDFEIYLKEIGLGLGIALILWGVFWVGDKVASFLFDFARPNVDLIYGMKGGESSWLLIVLLLFIIGPGEEIFWRGFVQRRMMQGLGSNLGYIMTTIIYGLIHVWSFNLMLVLAALVIGALWGYFYKRYPQHLTALVISHAVWDALAFVVWPI